MARDARDQCGHTQAQPQLALSSVGLGPVLAEVVVAVLYLLLQSPLGSESHQVYTPEWAPQWLHCFTPDAGSTGLGVTLGKTTSIDWVQCPMPSSAWRQEKQGVLATTESTPGSCWAASEMSLLLAHSQACVFSLTAPQLVMGTGPLRKCPSSHCPGVHTLCLSPSDRL
jgi:hypothetical protein